MKLEGLKVGDELPKLKKPPITLEILKEYAEASGDHNPIHQDEKAAKEAGLPGVIAHGMLSMSYMGEFVLLLVQEGAELRKLNCGFKSMTFLGDEITVSGKVDKIWREGTRVHVVCALETRNQKGSLTCTGSAELLLQ